MSARYLSVKVRRKQERKQKAELLAEMRQWNVDPIAPSALKEMLRSEKR